MDIDSAKLIYKTSQECIKELGALLNTLNATLPPDEFTKVRVSTAQAMASLVDLCERHVYAHYDDMRPFDLVRKGK